MNSGSSASVEPGAGPQDVNVGSGCNPTGNPTMGDIISARFSRRRFLGGSLAVTAIASSLGRAALAQAQDAGAGRQSAFSFDEVEAGIDETHHVAEGYEADILLRWGDPIFEDAPAFDPLNQSAEAQRRQFGYNNDYVGFIPLDAAADRGLLLVNHEYTSSQLMFPGAVAIVEDRVHLAPPDRERVAIEMAAHGGTIVEISKVRGKWQVTRAGKLNRRITAETEMILAGPVAGHGRVRTGADPSGTKVGGTLNNCAGGVTPWGTYIMAEENFHVYFGGTIEAGHRETANYRRLGLPQQGYVWSRFHERFDLSREPNEPNRFGWMVEVDPFDPDSIPRKRTALGRFKHEGAESIVSRDGRVVFYLGDDEPFEYVYKFVTSDLFDPRDRAANMDLLDSGTLYVARFGRDGTLQWLPLAYGKDPLTAANGFESQADVLIETRRAADLLGATKMDRPEDIQPNPLNGRVYVMLTSNVRRTAEQVDAANPRAVNAFGHIIEITEDGGDFAATAGRWEILLKCGDPSVAEVGASFSSATTENGWFGMPDNCAIDSAGRLWVATDSDSASRADGLWAVDTEGEARATSRLFFRAPIGAELCGPVFTPDSGTAFVAVQHPGEVGDRIESFGRPSYYEDPLTRWPDFREDMPVRPAVVAITRRGGGKIGM